MAHIGRDGKEHAQHLYPLSVYACPNGHGLFYSRAAVGGIYWHCPDRECQAEGTYVGCDGEGMTWMRDARPVKEVAVKLASGDGAED